MRLATTILAFLVCSTFGLPTEGDEPEGCTLCRENVQKLMDHALEKEAIQEYLLIYTVN